MLVDNADVMRDDPILDIISEGRKTERLSKGIYKTYHFGSSHFVPGWNSWPAFKDLNFNCYGICDAYEQVLASCPEIESSTKEYLVCVTPVERADQPEVGGWRWHKWGPYIGAQIITREYLFDESLIERVLYYHVYERLTNSK